MFYQLLYIHLFRPFLKYSQATSPLPPNISPRRLCTQAAQAVSKLLRLYKRSHGLRQICNIAVYIAHSACTIHLLNLPDKNAKRDITHGVKHLEEIAESWLCARRTLAILSVLSRQWKVELPDEAIAVLNRTDAKFVAWNQDIQSRVPRLSTSPPVNSPRQAVQPSPNILATIPSGSGPSATDLKWAQSPQTLPPQNASDLNRRAHEPQAMSRSSIDSTGASPSALFGGTENLPQNDDRDWWINDQRQLAYGFGQWPAESMEGRAVTSPNWMGNGVTSPPSNMGTPTAVGLHEDDSALMNLFSNLTNRNSGSVWGNALGMQYPNEGEWYQ
jgi:hypothetical protein